MRPERPDVRGRPHLKGRNEVEDPERSGGLRHAAAGLEGSAAHPAPPGKAKTNFIAQRAMAAGARPGACRRGGAMRQGSKPKAETS